MLRARIGAKICVSLLISTFLHWGGLSTETASWPAGKYSLPKAQTGCPVESWKVGWLRQEMENDIANPSDRKSEFSPNFHMNASLVSGTELGKGYEFVDRTFCTKTNLSDEEGRNDWPKGMYCIYKKSSKCPNNMVEGSITWDDEDNFDSKNRNKHGGALPEFISNTDIYGYTKLYYCCQNQGQWYKPIVLPIQKPFYLLPYGSQKCQQVTWAISSLEYIVYNTEDLNNQDRFYAHHVFSDEARSSPKVFYCYYTGCRHELRGEAGWLRSPSIDDSISDYHCCSWYITVNASHNISLEFRHLDIPNCEESSLTIYNGHNESNSMLLANYCGGNASSGIQVISRTNELYIVFKHKRNAQHVRNSSTTFGFLARYRRIVHAKTKTLRTTQLIPTKLFSSTEGKRQTSKGDDPKKYLSIVLPIVALCMLLVLAFTLAKIYLKRRKNKGSGLENTAANNDCKSKRRRLENGNSISSSERQVGPIVTSNPVYESQLNVALEITDDTVRCSSADNILYEPHVGNIQENVLYEGCESEGDATYAEPTYRGIHCDLRPY